MQSQGIKFGLIAGVGTIAYFLLFYFTEKQWMLGPVVYYSSLIITIACMYLAVKNDKASKEALYTYRDGLKPGFQVFVIASALFYVFYYLIYQWDPSLESLQREMMASWLEKVTLKDNLDKALRELEKADLSVTFKTSLLGFARGAIGGFILAVALALFMKDPKEDSA